MPLFLLLSTFQLAVYSINSIYLFFIFEVSEDFPLSKIVIRIGKILKVSSWQHWRRPTSIIFHARKINGVVDYTFSIGKKNKVVPDSHDNELFVFPVGEKNKWQLEKWPAAGKKTAINLQLSFIVNGKNEKWIILLCKHFIFCNAEIAMGYFVLFFKSSIRSSTNLLWATHCSTVLPTPFSGKIEIFRKSKLNCFT